MYCKIVYVLCQLLELTTAAFRATILVCRISLQMCLKLKWFTFCQPLQLIIVAFKVALKVVLYFLSAFVVNKCKFQNYFREILSLVEDDSLSFHKLPYIECFISFQLSKLTIVASTDTFKKMLHFLATLMESSLLHINYRS